MASKTVIRPIKGNDEANGTLLYINSDSSDKNGKRGFNRSESI